MKRLTAVYERDESGAWIVRVPRVRGCHTYGRTVEQARSRLPEVLRLFDVDPGTVRIVDDVRLPGRLREKIRRVRRARARAEIERDAARRELREAVVMLVEAGLSRRDAGELLGLSRQRVQQLKAGSG